MTKPPTQNALATLPQIDKLLKHSEIAAWENRLILPVRTALLRKTLEEARVKIISGAAPPKEEDLIQEVLKKFSRLLRPSLRKAINGTGIVLHTNLGRAPIPKDILSQLDPELSGYCTLEIDTETAHRGKRALHIEEMLAALTGAEDALVVNNGAAAVFLMLNALSFGRETIISRGELVQIGGGFRMPEILLQSGAVLKEVGTTNITSLRDYENSVSDKTALILKVHPSCFSITGHTESPSLLQLSQAAHGRGLPLAVDWGSGALKSREGGELSIAEILNSGADLLSFSGDKLFGSSQAGIIVGKKEFVERLKKSPLSRALRLGKLDLFVLERTLQGHLAGEASLVDELLGLSLSDLESRADAFSKALQEAGVVVKKEKGLSPIGGGSTPNEELETVFLEMEVSDSEKAARELSSQTPPIFVRKEKGKIAIDLRTVFPEDEALLIKGLSSLS